MENIIERLQNLMVSISELKPAPVSKIAKPSSRTTSKERVEEKKEPVKVEKKPKEASKPSVPPPTANAVKEKVSEENREPVAKNVESVTKKPSPVKKRAIETEEGKLERQGTHTIMTLVDKSKNSLPGPEQSPTKVRNLVEIVAQNLEIV